MWVGPAASRLRLRFRPGPGENSERGVSLLEVLVAVAVIGTAMVAAMAGLFTTVREAGANGERQQRSAALMSFGESLKGAQYLPCAEPGGGSYTDAYRAWPQRWSPPAGAAPDIASLTLAVSRVEYWDRATSSFTSSCPTDGGAQRLTITASWRGSSASSTLVKRDPRAVP